MTNIIQIYDHGLKRSCKIDYNPWVDIFFKKNYNSTNHMWFQY